MNRFFLILGVIGLVWAGSPLPTSAQLLASTRSQAPTETSQPRGMLTLKQALLQLKAHCEVDLLFEKTLIQSREGVATRLNLNSRLEVNLQALLNPYGLRYKRIRANTYLIMADKVSGLTATPVGMGSRPLEASLQAHSLPSVTTGLPINARVTALAERSVTGRVTSETGEGLPGVSVVIKSAGGVATRGTTTDAEGRYRLPIPSTAIQFNPALTQNPNYGK